MSLACETMSLVGLPDLHRYVAHFMGDAPLPFNERVNAFQGLQDAGIAFRDDELQVFAQKPPALEIGKESSPGLCVPHFGS